MNNRAQITLFIILSLLLLTILGMFIWAGTRIPQTAKTTQQDVQSQSQAVHAYLEACLEQISLDTIELWARQGGQIYFSQGGIQPEPEQFISFEGKKIPYLILPPEGTVGTTYFSTTPEYPWEGFPYLSTGQEWLYGYYGRSMLAPLYDLFSFSAQQSLSQSIQNSMKTQCTEMNSFGNTIKILSTLNVSIFLAQDTVAVLNQEAKETIIIKAIIPIEKTEGEKTFYWQESINIEKPIHITKLYHVIKQAIEQDTTKIDYSISGVHFNDYVITKLKQGADDLIMIRDEKSMVNSRALEFWFARKNRQPGLFHVSNPGIPVCPETILLFNQTTTQVDILNSCGTNMSIFLKALDPDEDSVTYLFAPKLPHIITEQEAVVTNSFVFTIIAQDQENSTDSQIITIPLRSR